MKVIEKITVHYTHMTYVLICYVSVIIVKICNGITASPKNE